MNSLISVPTFARIEEYAGLWAYEPTRFAHAWQVYTQTDWARHMAAAQPSRGASVEYVAGRSGKVAIIKATGTLMKAASSTGGTSTIQIRRDIRAASADKEVSAILLAIDSPGGTVAGTSDLAADVASARRSKPVWAHIDDLGASAAYWIASQADAVFANSETALVGSIGTIMTVYDLSKNAEKEGVRAMVFATGPLKGAGTPGTEITSEQAEYFQAMVEESQRSFDNAVMRGRGMSASELAAVRTGAVFSAARAKDLRLIDGIRSMDDTLEAIAKAK